MNAVHTLSQLNRHTDDTLSKRTYLGRLWQTVKIIREKNGSFAATTAGCSMVIGSIYSLTFSYFCFEGAVRSLQEASHTFEETGKLSQSIGDAGGWFSLPIFSLFALNTVLRQCIREGEFSQVKQICEEWHQKIDHDNLNQISIDSLYSHIHHILDEVSRQCFLPKNVIHRKLIALEIMEGLLKIDEENVIDPDCQLSLDLKLKSTYLEIEETRKIKCSLSKYFHRIHTGLKNTEGTRERNRDLITGIVCPMFLTFGSFCSAIGTPILGQKIFIEREDIVEVGHFGEWPDNLVSSSVIAYSLNKDLVLKGDIHLLNSIFQKHLDGLNPILNSKKGDKDLYNRLCEVANEEIKQLKLSFLIAPALHIHLFQKI